VSLPCWCFDGRVADSPLHTVSIEYCSLSPPGNNYSEASIHLNGDDDNSRGDGLYHSKEA